MSTRKRPYCSAVTDQWVTSVPVLPVQRLPAAWAPARPREWEQLRSDAFDDRPAQLVAAEDVDIPATVSVSGNPRRHGVPLNAVTA